MSGYWPLFDLRVRGPRVDLRPVTEADLAHLADVVPADAEPDPSLPSHAVADARVRRGIALHQAYWRAWANWSAEAWRLGFVVAVDGEVAGFTEVEAERFARRRTVETGSWLVPRARGRGIGKEMRAAMLHLGFDGLGAAVAETEAWHDDAASLGVSRSLGYEPNGEWVHDSGDRCDRMVRMRLTRARWEENPLRASFETTGLEACLPLFGLPPAG